MGIRLIVEVMDHAPAELTPSERLLLLYLAESARDETRQAYPGREALMRRMRTDEWDTVASVLRGLAKKGYEVRVQRATGADGRPIFASKGSQSTYRIPAFARTAREVPV